jgi:hypothetical protein
MNAVIAGQIYFASMVLLTVLLALHQKKYVGKIIKGKLLISFLLFFIPILGFIYYIIQLYKNVKSYDFVAN